MSERPILMSGPMVRAILESRKTQTRLAIRNQPHDGARILVERYSPTVVDRHGEEQPGAEIYGAYSDDGEWGCKCPHGQPLDKLWLRETWQRATDFGHDTDRFFYQATYTNGGPFDDVTKWRPSIFMPRWASRITLEITGVRVERLQDISYEDACAEGCSYETDRFEPTADGETWNETARRLCWPQRSYRQVWESINGVGSWDANPWVWVIEFKRIAP